MFALKYTHQSTSMDKSEYSVIQYVSIVIEDL